MWSPVHLHHYCFPLQTSSCHWKLPADGLVTAADGFATLVDDGEAKVPVVCELDEVLLVAPVLPGFTLMACRP